MLCKEREGNGIPRFRWPSCSAPIVGTTPTLFPCSLARRLHLLSCARSWNTGMSECGDGVSGRSDMVVYVRRKRSGRGSMVAEGETSR